ncbi:MAG: cell division protein FtsQ/DivIB [Gammaproteobacteria bacterium]
MRRHPGGQARANAPSLPWRVRLLPWLRLGTQATLILALGVAVSAGSHWVRDPENLPLRSLRVEGEFRALSAEQVRAAVAGAARGSFFTVNVEAVRRAAESLPWVASARVRRVWPDTLHLQVVEQRAAARWGEAGLLNPSGQLFMPDAASLPPRLPHLSGPEAQRQRVMQTYVAMTALLAPLGRHVAELHLDARRSWLLRLDSGVEVRLGRRDELAQLERFVRVYPTAFAARQAELSRVDLRYSNGLAVRWDRASDTSGQQQEG